MASRTSGTSLARTTSLTRIRETKKGTLTHPFSRSMMPMRSSSCTASEARSVKQLFTFVLTHLRTFGPGGCTYADDATHANARPRRQYGYSFLLYYHTWSYPHTPCTLLFFVTPHPFSRVATCSGHLAFCCILIVFFCHAR